MISTDAIASPTPASTEQPDLQAIKARQQGVWSLGDYAVVGTTLQIVGESLCEALDLRAGSRVLDVAAGNGNASLAAARRWCDVVATDYVPGLLDLARRRAEAEGMHIRIREADAEALPCSDEAWDVVLSVFGVMFAPNQEQAAAELVRVCRRGGRIGLANWTPDGFIGQLFKTVGRHVPPPPGLRSPALWGTRERLAELFGPLGCTLEATERSFAFRYRSPEHFVEVFRDYYGPVRNAFDRLGPEGQAELERDLLQLIGAFNRSGDDTMVVPSAYLEVMIRRS